MGTGEKKTNEKKHVSQISPSIRELNHEVFSRCVVARSGWYKRQRVSYYTWQHVCTPPQYPVTYEVAIGSASDAVIAILYFSFYVLCVILRQIAPSVAASAYGPGGFLKPKVRKA